MEHAELIAMGFALHGLPVSVSAHYAFLELPKHSDTYDCAILLILRLHVEVTIICCYLPIEFLTNDVDTG